MSQKQMNLCRFSILQTMFLVKANVRLKARVRLNTLTMHKMLQAALLQFSIYSSFQLHLVLIT